MAARDTKINALERFKRIIGLADRRAAGIDDIDDSTLLELRDKAPARLAPSPQALGIWELAWPTMIAALMHTIVRWADVKMVGDLGVDAVAGVAAGGQIYWVVQAVAMALPTGLVALIARAFGARDFDLADATLRQSILMGAGFGVISLVFMAPFLRPSILVLGVTDSVADYGAQYLLWLFAGNAPFMLTFVFAAALRAAGDSRTPLYVGIIANAINIFLNWLLIYGHWGFPALGVVGAGMASSISMVVQCIVFWLMWSSGRMLIKPRRRRFRPDWALWSRILKIGYPAAIEGALFQAGILMFMRVISEFGTEAFTAYQIGVQVLAAAFLPGHGFASAASTVIGQHLGAKDPDAAERAGWRSLGLAMLFMGLLGIAMILISEPFARWFLDNDGVVVLAVNFIFYLGIVQPLMAVEFAIGGALRGAGDTRFPMFAVFTGFFGGRLVPAAIAAYAFDASVQTVWSFLMADYLIKAALLAWRFRQGRWKVIDV